MPMPTITDLQGMYGDWNPQAYMQAQENAGLERQFRESQYGEQQAKTRKDELANMYSEQDRPGVMEQQRLTNQNLGYTGTGQDIKNKEGALTLERNTKAQQWNLDADQRKAMMQLTKDDIEEAGLVIEKMFQSGKPELIEKARELSKFTKFVRDEQTKHDYAMAKQKAGDDAAMARQRVSTGGTIAAAKIGATSRETVATTKAAKSKGALDVMAALQSGKVTPANGALALNAAAAKEQDADTKEMYLTLARIAETIHRQGPAPAGGGKITVEGVGRTPPAPLATPNSGRTSSGPVLPEGAKQVGTSGGKPVYELPDGRRVKVE